MQKEKEDYKQQLIRQALCVHESHAVLPNTARTIGPFGSPITHIHKTNDDSQAAIRTPCPNK
jgi:hypothetical protein